MFTHIQKGGLLWTGQEIWIGYPFKKEEESMFTHIQKGGLLLIRTGQVGRYE
jgi:hypothetical protein